MSNVIEFKRPDKPAAESPLLYTVDIYANATFFFDPNRDEVDKQDAAAHMFRSAYFTHVDADDCKALVMIGGTRTDVYRNEHSFETAAQRAWLARRLDDAYESLTGRRRPGILRSVETFIRNLFNRSRP